MPVTSPGKCRVLDVQQSEPQNIEREDSSIFGEFYFEGVGSEGVRE